MARFVSVGLVSKILGASVSTLRRWEREGQPVSERTPSGHRRYDLHTLQPERNDALSDQKRTITYARVSSHGQKADLERQKKILEMYCVQKGWAYEVVADLGSGMNYRKKRP